LSLYAGITVDKVVEWSLIIMVRVTRYGFMGVDLLL
jgi:hypothetical protein